MIRVNVKEYLSRKYKVDTPTTMTKIEARAFGIPYPLRNGWLKEFGGREVWLKTLKILACDLDKRLKKQERRNKKNAKHTKSGLDLARRAAAKIDLQVQNVTSDAFLESYEWRRVRMEALKKYGPRCQCCGATPADGLKMHVDHIKPRRLFPHLALDVTNLQILCAECNHGKGNWDMTDWRATPEILVVTQGD